MASEGPRDTKKNATLTVGRGPVPRHRSRNPTLAGDRPPHYDKITVHERSRGTGPRATNKKCLPRTVGRGPVPRQCSGPRATQRSRGTGPRATGKITVLEPSRGKPARMRVWHPRAPALRGHRDPEVSPTRPRFFHRGAGAWHQDVARVMKHPQLKFIDDAGGNNKGKLRNLR